MYEQCVLDSLSFIFTKRIKNQVNKPENIFIIVGQHTKRSGSWWMATIITVQRPRTVAAS